MSGVRPQPKYSELGKAIASTMNESFLHFPKQTVGCLLALEVVSLYGTYSVLNIIPSANDMISLDFALAFALSRPLRRLRFPLDVAFSAALCKIFPSLTLVKIRNLGRLFPQPSLPKNKALRRLVDMMAEVVDRYGAGYFIGARYSGLLVVLSLYGMISSGMDATALLVNWLGVQEDTVEKVGDVLGTWAASVTFSALLYPFTIVGGTLLAPRIAGFKFRK